jgi:hypothetical protein
MLQKVEQLTQQQSVDASAPQKEIAMDVVLWIVAGLAAAAFFMAGATKLALGKKVEEKGMAWAKHYSDGGVRGIGVAEVAGALGLILPAVTGIATWLVPSAALGLVVVMVGAVRRHTIDGEGLKGSMPAIVLGVLALVVAIGRIWIAPFGG